MPPYVLVVALAVLLVVVLWLRASRRAGKWSRLGENVRFSVYRPRIIAPQRWYPMLVFAHLSERRAGEDEPDPLEEVARQAGRLLGEQSRDFERLTQDSMGTVPREGELTLVPMVHGVEFNPTRRTFKWLEDVHREEFRLRTSSARDGETLRGSMAVFLGSILLAEITLALRVDSSQGASENAPALEPVRARPYRRIFASYSHLDLAIVSQFERYARAIGDRYLRDLADLRSGEVWTEQLARMIEDADVFQLFWSSNSMHSPFVRQEWQHALALDRPEFVRPTYWEVPLPESPEEGLPPEELKRLHFQYVAVAPSADQEVESETGRGGGRPMRSRLGLAAAIAVPVLVSLAAGVLSGGHRWMWAVPSEPTVRGQLLRALGSTPVETAIFCLLAMLGAGLARMIGGKLWTGMLRRGQRFWFVAALLLSLGLTLLPASRPAIEMGLLHEAADIALVLLPAVLSRFVSVWLAYAWMRWVFLRHFLAKGVRE